MNLFIFVINSFFLCKKNLNGPAIDDQTTIHHSIINYIDILCLKLVEHYVNKTTF